MTKAILAYAIHTIHRRNGNNEPEVIPASETGKPSIFPTNKEEFDKLEKLNAVRKPTDDEIAVAKAAAERAGNALSDEVPETPASTDKNKQPASGAAGDPAGTPKAVASKTSAKSGSDDLNV